MINKIDFLEKIITGKGSWTDYQNFLGLEESDLVPFFNYSKKITIQNFGNKLKIYTPNKRFPAISITGSECSLGCDHCNKKYLEGMKPIINNADLENYLIAHYKNGGIGALISGGCNLDGSVPILNFLDTIKKIKKCTNLIINIHTGLLNEETANKLANAKIDIVSFDINLDDEIIKDIYHLKKNVKDYKNSVDLLKKYNLRIIPHICVGLHYGTLHKELESIKFLKELNPPLIIVIALIPPKNIKENQKKKFKIPKPIDVAKIIALIRFLLPKTEISLGCMRPKGNLKVEFEKYAIKSGITRIEIPSKKTIDWVKKNDLNISFSFYSGCCSIPEELEKLAESSIKEIQRYLI